MCDYSLHGVSSRPAKVSDKLITTKLGKSSSRGFAAVGECGPKLVIHDDYPRVAVCLLPGTELAFEDNVRYDRAVFGNARLSHKVARFRQIDLDDPQVQHDALEFPDGQTLKIARLTAGQTAIVLQLPVATQRPEPADIRNVARSSEPRIVVNRASLRPGVASILLPNQGTVMFWQAFRSTAIALFSVLVQSLVSPFGRLKADKQLPGHEFDDDRPSLRNGTRTATLSTKPLAHEEKVEVKTAAPAPEKQIGLLD